MPSQEWFGPLVAAMAWLGMFGMAVRHVWGNFKIRRLGFTFYITDLWAGIIGLLPTYLSIPMLKSTISGGTPVLMLVAASMFLAQLLGMADGVVLAKDLEGSARSRWYQALLVIHGALIGYVANLGTLLIAFIIGAGAQFAPCCLLVAIGIMFWPFIFAWLGSRNK